MVYFSKEEVLEHNKPGDVWFIYQEKVYNVSSYIQDHPGGSDILLEYAGCEITEEFEDIGHSSDAFKILSKFYIGELLQKRGSDNEINENEKLKAMNECFANDQTDIVGIHKICQEFQLTGKTKVSTNSYIYKFKLPQDENTLGHGIGQHILVSAKIEDKIFERPYTPISKVDQKGYFQLLIKSYDTGNISKYMESLEIGSMVRIKGPKGSYRYLPNKFDRYNMVAGGTGITPLISIISEILSKSNSFVCLLYCNRTEDDILLKSELDKFTKVYPERFTVIYFLSLPSKSWKGEIGYIDEKVMTQFFSKHKESALLICGPPKMIYSIKTLCSKLGYDEPNLISKWDDQVFIF